MSSLNLLSLMLQILPIATIVYVVYLYIFRNSLCPSLTHIWSILFRLALLWYHTIIRPFYALDGLNVKAGVEAANLLMQESEQLYADSALFLFFKGRIYRLDVSVYFEYYPFDLNINWHHFTFYLTKSLRLRTIKWFIYAWIIWLSHLWQFILLLAIYIVAPE